MHTTIDDTIVPGPILAIGTFLYQQDDTPGRNACNLWGGSLQAHNGNEPRHVEKAMKLFLAAEDMLEALKLIKSLPGFEPTEPYAAVVNAAITKAEQGIEPQKLVSAGARPYPE